MWYILLEWSRVDDGSARAFITASFNDAKRNSRDGDGIYAVATLQDAEHVVRVFDALAQEVAAGDPDGAAEIIRSHLDDAIRATEVSAPVQTAEALYVWAATYQVVARSDLEGFFMSEVGNPRPPSSTRIPSAATDRFVVRACALAPINGAQAYAGWFGLRGDPPENKPSGARLYRMGQDRTVTLPQEMVDDLNISPGEMVFFVKSTIYDGEWIVQSEARGLAELAEAMADIE